jgi:N-hydroxyarylamine O-acetyltransferase
MCHYQQTSADSPFTQKSVCSLATGYGRVTLSNDALITTTGEGRREKKVAGEDEYRLLLEDHFGVTLPADARLDRPSSLNNTPLT